MKKTVVLVALFVLPIVAYLFFLSGTNNFGRLPTLTENVVDIDDVDSGVSFKDKITILGFLGRDVQLKKANAFNLNQKIYKRFYEFNDFQFIMMVPEGMESEVAALKSELGTFTDTQKWVFVFAKELEIRTVFEGLETDLKLNTDLSTPYVFIIDKDGNLRGRTDDEDEGTKYGFDTTSVAELNNKMEDDVKIILAEYRLALKKNTARRDK
ncbi:hypothetical protein FK220_003320 [Flavobacteriaceae bacterium TP-CH-4]|uniref:Uncharacterized protein n=1 Tax=Pelagihabitans pacificus TaxID=2696054 RepID=A0A967ARW6_9FLAO|nr:hypothetical protein [Pelagihabitans pacificus]NHF58355.1 hypothetical protein [Pelagihabitans pacificus]